jgi:hypothetical protein
MQQALLGPNLVCRRTWRCFSSLKGHPVTRPSWKSPAIMAREQDEQVRSDAVRKARVAPVHGVVKGGTRHGRGAHCVVRRRWSKAF